MICYRDKTFCDYWRSCVDGEICDRAMTDEVYKSACEVKLPIARFAERPDCWESNMVRHED